jgi:hypothetical protein
MLFLGMGMLSESTALAWMTHLPSIDLSVLLTAIHSRQKIKG